MYLPLSDNAENRTKHINEQSSKVILAGFDYEVVEGEPYHFSYDTFDQQNYTDDYNLAMMEDETSTIIFCRTGYHNIADGTVRSSRYAFTPAMFIELYKASQAHKQTALTEAYTRKQEVERILFEYQGLNTPATEDTQIAVENMLAV